MFLALLVLLADGLVKVPPSQWKGVELKVPDAATSLSVSFNVQSGSSRVQALLLEPGQAQRYHEGRAFRALYSTSHRHSGSFRYFLPEPGNYVLMLDNRLEGRHPAFVTIKVQTMGRNLGPVRELPADQRRLVVTISLLLLGSVVFISGLLFLRHTT